MLTLDILKANETLKGLSADQLNAIVTLSKNDEEATIGKKIGELHGSYENDILSVTSVAKKDGEKSYDYLKRVLNDYKTKVSERDTLTQQLKEQKDKVEQLQKQVTGGDSEVATQLKDEKDLTAKLRKQITDKDTELAAAKKDYEAKLLGFRVDTAFDSVFGGLTFRQDVSDAVKSAMKQAARSEVLAKGTLSYDESLGTLVLRDANDQIVRNQGNMNNPYTLAELVAETSIKDVLQKPKTGNGTTPPSGGSGGSGKDNLLDLSGAKTQAAADDLISAHLEAKGFNRESDEFWEQYNTIREENGVSALPLR